MLIGFVAGSLNRRFSPPPLVVTLKAPAYQTPPDYQPQRNHQKAMARLDFLESGMAEEYRSENDIFPQMSDREYVDLLYMTLYGRHAFTDGEDGNNWVEVLGKGATRGWVAWNQFRSEEFMSAHQAKAAK